MRSAPLYFAVLAALKADRPRFISIDDIMSNKEVNRRLLLPINAYSSRALLTKEKSREAIRSAISFLRRKGHIIESRKERIRTTYLWLGQ